MAGALFLEGKNVELRTVEEEDIERLRDIVNLREVRSGLGYAHPFNLEGEEDWFESIQDEDIVLAICVDGEVIGNIALERSDRESSRRAEFGIMIDPDHHGNGYGSEAVELLIEHAFDELNLHKLEARAHESNEASQSIWEKFGFEQEGVRREQIFKDGEYRDAYWYGLLRREWRDQ